MLVFEKLNRCCTIVCVCSLIKLVMKTLFLGVLPLCVYHSGIKDVLDKVKETQPELEALMNIPVVPGGDLGTSNGANLLKVRI